MNLMGWALVFALGVVGVRWLLPKLKARTPKGRERAELRALLRACHGDDHLAERLVFSELQRDSRIGYEKAARRARKRLERDRAR